MAAVPVTRLVGMFLRIGNLTFGGGEPTMALLQQELVVRRGWATSEQYALAYALARITPGTNVLAYCAAMAWFLGGWPAAVACVVAATAPSAAVVVALTVVYEAVKNHPLASGAIGGLVAGAAGMMAAAAWNLLRPRLGPSQRWRTLLLASGALVAVARFGVSPVVVLGLAALIGSLWRVRPAAAAKEPS